MTALCGSQCTSLMHACTCVTYASSHCSLCLTSRPEPYSVFSPSQKVQIDLLTSCTSVLEQAGGCSMLGPRHAVRHAQKMIALVVPVTNRAKMAESLGGAYGSTQCRFSQEQHLPGLPRCWRLPWLCSRQKLACDAFNSNNQCALQLDQISSAAA